MNIDIRNLGDDHAGQVELLKEYFGEKTNIGAVKEAVRYFMRTTKLLEEAEAQLRAAQDELRDFRRFQTALTDFVTPANKVEIDGRDIIRNQY